MTRARHNQKVQSGPRREHNKQTSTKPNEQPHTEPLFFYMPDAIHGEFCQWYRANFVVSRAEIARLVGRETTPADETGSIEFNCAEQFMMYCKAARFNDTARQDRVLATPDPKEQKRLGKLTVGFTNEGWDPVKSLVVVAGNVAKFGQNPGLGRKLLATGERTLCEAASRDRVWGIGYSEKHALNFREHWGENRLGKALMEVRWRLREEEEARSRDDWDYEEADN